MDISQLDHRSLVGFSLLFLRVVGLIFAAPFFGNRAIPKRTKVAFSLILTGLLFPFIPSLAGVPTSPLPIAFAVAKELLIGICLGFALYLLFEAVVFFGQIVSYQMGFAIVSSIDPESQQRVPIIGQFEYLLVLLVFLALNGHHLLLSGLYSSLRTIPLGQGIPELIAPPPVDRFDEKRLRHCSQIGCPSYSCIALWRSDNGIDGSGNSSDERLYHWLSHKDRNWFSGLSTLYPPFSEQLTPTPQGVRRGAHHPAPDFGSLSRGSIQWSISNGK